MLSHDQIWAVIDRLAERHMLSASALARKAGLDPTTFNKSKRIGADGRPRWPSTESLSKILDATGSSLDEMFRLFGTNIAYHRAPETKSAIPLLGFAEAGQGGYFDDAGFPVGQGWDEITFPVRYGSDWKYAKEVMEKVLTEVVGDFSDRSKLAWEKVVEKYRVENAEVTPTVTLNADQNWLTYTLRYVVDYRKRRSTKDRIFTRLLEEVDKAPQRIRIATASFELLSVPPVEVQIQRQP